MICAIDFGSCWMRSVFRNPASPERLTMYSEKSEYALIADTAQHQRALEEQQIPFAICEGSLVVAGNQAAKARWLSRVPCAPLLPDGIVPTNDPPARQILSLLIQAMLPSPTGQGDLCIVTVPGARNAGETSAKNAKSGNEDFLLRLIRMQGYRVQLVNAAEAALLSTCSDATFTGISIVMGAETTDICLARYGVPLALETISVGCNWIDTELARQFQIQVWDEDGNAYLDLESVRLWKQVGQVHLRNCAGDRERMMSRLFSVVLDRVARTVSQMLAAASVRNALQGQRVSVMLSGGAAMIDGFGALLTERFIEHEIAERVLAIRCASDPCTAVVRGALIFGELESRSMANQEAA
jgi:hypothetical protein